MDSIKSTFGKICMESILWIQDEIIVSLKLMRIHQVEAIYV